MIDISFETPKLDLLEPFLVLIGCIEPLLLHRSERGQENWRRIFLAVRETIQECRFFPMLVFRIIIFLGSPKLDGFV